MIAQCPRCGSPRQGDRAFCQGCGFDYRTVQAQAEPAQQLAPPAPEVPAAPVIPVAPVSPPPAPTYAPQQFGQAPQFGQQAPQFGQQAPQFGQQAPQFGQQPPQFGQQPPQFGQQAAAPYGAPQPPTNCPRCNAPIYPGYQVCNSCGLDLRNQFGGPGMPPTSVPGAKKSSVPMLLVVGAIALAVAAGGFFVMNQNNKNNASPNPSASVIAVVTGSPEVGVSSAPSDPVTVTPGKSATPAPSKAPKSQAPATSANGGTPAGWTAYTAPDGSWSAQFPSKPMSSNTTSGSAGASMNVTMYYSVDAASGAAYFVATMDAGSLLTTMGTDNFLELMAQSMGPAMAGQSGASVTSTTDSTLSGHPAKTFVIQAGGGTEAVMTMSAVGSRVYMVLTTNASSGSAFTDYFMASFKLK